jgi:Family of unknown function (DUF6335)
MAKRKKAPGKNTARKPAAKAAKKAAKKAAPKRAATKKASARKAASKKASSRKAAAKSSKKAAAKKASRSIPKAARAAEIRSKASPRTSKGNIERKTTRHSEPTSDRPSIPSSLTVDQRKARTRRNEFSQRVKAHPETGPAMTAGDVDADWEQAYSSGDEAPGGDNPTPDQDVVEEIGGALGVTYQDGEELKGADKISDRDRHRWELDPASAEDYPEHDR